MEDYPQIIFLAGNYMYSIVFPTNITTRTQPLKHEQDFNNFTEFIIAWAKLQNAEVTNGEQIDVAN
jgi:hypothetical protein